MKLGGSSETWNFFLGGTRSPFMVLGAAIADVSKMDIVKARGNVIQTGKKSRDERQNFLTTQAALSL